MKSWVLEPILWIQYFCTRGAIVRSSNEKGRSIRDKKCNLEIWWVEGGLHWAPSHIFRLNGKLYVFNFGDRLSRILAQMIKTRKLWRCVTPKKYLLPKTECYGEDARTDEMKVKDCEELQMQKEDEVTLVEFPDKYPPWGWCVQIVCDKIMMCPDSLAPKERPDDPQPRHHRLHHWPPVSGATIKDQHPCYQTLSRFTSTRSPASGSCASQGWESKMVVNTVVRCAIKSSLRILRKVTSARSHCEYGKYCSRLDPAAKVHPFQANTTPRREARILLEVEETQAEIVGPAELFLR